MSAGRHRIEREKVEQAMLKMLGLERRFWIEASPEEGSDADVLILLEGPLASDGNMIELWGSQSDLASGATSWRPRLFTEEEADTWLKERGHVTETNS